MSDAITQLHCRHAYKAQERLPERNMQRVSSLVRLYTRRSSIKRDFLDACLGPWLPYTHIK